MAWWQSQLQLNGPIPTPDEKNLAFGYQDLLTSRSQIPKNRDQNSESRLLDKIISSLTPHWVNNNEGLEPGG